MPPRDEIEFHPQAYRVQFDDLVVTARDIDIARPPPRSSCGWPTDAPGSRRRAVDSGNCQTCRTGTASKC